MNEQELSDLQSELKSYVIGVVDTLHKALESRFERLDEQQEQFERQLATLTIAYAEVAALVQALMSMLMNGDDPEKTREFNEHIKLARQTMMDNLSYAAKQAEQSVDKFVALSTDDVSKSESDQ